MHKHLFFAIILTVCALFLVVFELQGKAAEKAQSETHPKFLTSAACKACHIKEYESWQTSHHSWALRKATEKNVLGNFDNAELEHYGLRSRFFKKEGKPYVETDGPDGKAGEFEIKYTVGVTPLQQYLIQLDGGRLQALDLAWDTIKKRWFHLYPGEKLTSENGLHWTGPYKNWNARCAECHQTNFEKNYDSKTRSYQSKWSELTIGCEACHGPGQAHLAWAKDPAAFKKSEFKGIDDKGLTFNFQPKNPEAEIQLCAKCHARREAFSGNSSPAGGAFSDHYRLALLRSNLYHADGQIDEEVYVYGSFLQSKMYAKGVRCTNCHEPHGLDLTAKENAVCTQCHSKTGNPDFPSLKKSAYDDQTHHRHEPGSDGAKCISCHMPVETYMQVDPRRDHSFRVPRPDLTRKIGTPNACNACHGDKSAEWAAKKLVEWFPDGRGGKPHYGEVFHRAQTKPDKATGNDLAYIALNKTAPAIVRATALNHLHQFMTPEITKRVLPLQKDENSLIRSAFLRLFSQGPQRLRAGLAAPLLTDPMKDVRLAASRLLLDVPSGELQSTDKKIVQDAFNEYWANLAAMADFPETQMQIAGVAMISKKLGAAEKALETALSMDPQLTQAWFTLGRIQIVRNAPEKALNSLEHAHALAPKNAGILATLAHYHLRLKNNEKAKQYISLLGKYHPQHPDFLRLKNLGPSD